MSTVWIQLITHENIWFTLTQGLSIHTQPRFLMICHDPVLGAYMIHHLSHNVVNMIIFPCKTFEWDSKPLPPAQTSYQIRIQHSTKPYSYSWKGYIVYEPIDMKSYQFLIWRIYFFFQLCISSCVLWI